MNRIIFSVITSLFFSLIQIPPAYAAPNCVQPQGNSCSSIRPCCTPIAGKDYICISSFTGGGGRAGGGAASTCVQEQIGVTCVDAPSTCGSIGAKSCCSKSASGQPLTCNTAKHQCEVANTSIHSQCSTETNKCGGANGGCCNTTDANKNPLTCVDSSGKPTAFDGTCKYTALTDTKANQTLNCHCDQPGVPGDGKNGFWCDGQGKDNDGKDYRVFCPDSGQACMQGSNLTIYMGDNSTHVNGNNDNYDSVLKGHTAKGVNCLTPITPSEPPPPSPPCMQGGWSNGQCTGLITALGQLDTDTSGFTSRLFAILLSFAGGIALLLIIRAGYNLITSQGKPEQVQNGRDQLIAAIVGLVFLIFSLVLLQVIGFDILKIPGFSASTNGSGIPLNGTCNVNSSNCASGLTCVYSGSQGQCKALVPKGGTCTVGVAGQCAGGLSCLYNGSGGTCQ